ncbi:Nucleolin [Grifola frondosa]|uniref:Nucleolin n=1 Tax=Grifola frondosa TaxID=5627 RepID=A0A1C7MEH6_GRIFR|nr:Nucleolin [Grifola frondosa]
MTQSSTSAEMLTLDTFIVDKTLGGQSLGYSHVTFSSPNIARKAIEDSMWNPMYIEGRQIKVASARSGTVFRKLGRPMPPSRTLFVGGIPREAQYEDIQALWNDLAEIDYIRITYTEESKHRGFAHVDFKTSEDAQRIMSLHQTNPFRLSGRILRIGYAEVSKEELHKVGDVSSNRTICVTRLPINVRREELEAVFSHLGPISSTRIGECSTLHSGQGRAVAYIDFESAEFAKAVVNRCIQRQPVLEDGSVVRVAHAIRQGRVEYPPCNILFLPNYSSNEFQLRRDLGEHAKHVQRISIVGDLGNGESSRIAFIDFSNVALATEAKEAFYGNPGPLSAIGFSRPKELHQKEEAQQPVDLPPTETTMICARKLTLFSQPVEISRNGRRYLYIGIGEGM